MKKLNLPFNIPFTNNPYNTCCEYYPQDDGAMLVEWWNKALWWVFDNAVTVFHYADRVRFSRMLNV